MRKILILNLTLILLISINGFAQRNPGKLWEDKVFEPQFRSVMAFPAGAMPQAFLQPSVVGMNEDRPMILSFDELADEFDNYFVALIHCNHDWKESSLYPMDYLDEYNEFPILEYDFSRNTLVNYVNYRFQVPKVKLPGNYALVVYRNRNQDEIVFSKRVMFVDNQVNVGGRISFSAGVEQRNTHQQVEFTVAYPNLDLNNPSQEIRVVVRQNQRWDNALVDLKPYRVQETQRLLDYRNFDLKNNFPGGNEFRFFDLRALNFAGQNISNISKDPNFYIATLGADVLRSGKTYSETLDINGNFIPENNDLPSGQRDPDYVLTEFFLQSEKIDGKVKLMGALTNWGGYEEAEMQYDANANGYRTEVFVKQGWYDYAYSVESKTLPPYYFEGSRFETENLYEIIVYYRPIGARGDQIIGYQKIEANRRRD
ncbi:DUF5103 domain-containing protein [Fulvivirgaceae bacterium LMO-SS25]